MVADGPNQAGLGPEVRALPRHAGVHELLELHRIIEAALAHIFADDLRRAGLAELGISVLGDLVSPSGRDELQNFHAKNPAKYVAEIVPQDRLAARESARNSVAAIARLRTRS